MARKDGTVAVRTVGLGALNRALGRIDVEMKRDSVRHLREAAKQVRDTARPLTPVKTGRLQSSLRYQASARGASVSSALPYGPVHEFGGQISPRGTPITIPKSRMLGEAVKRETPRIEEELGQLLDVVSRRNGFR